MPQGRALKGCTFRSYNTSTFSAMRFDENKKGVTFLNFMLLSVVLK